MPAVDAALRSLTIADDTPSRRLGIDAPTIGDAVSRHVSV